MTLDTRKPKQDYPLRVDLEVLGKRLRQIRESRTPRLSREDVCSAVGLSMTTLVEIEKGVTNPTIDTLMRIVMALGIDLAPLIAEAEAAKSGKKPDRIDQKSGSAPINRQVDDELTSAVTMPFDTLHGASLPQQQKPVESASNEPVLAAESPVLSREIALVVAEVLEHISIALIAAGQAIRDGKPLRSSDEGTPRRRRTDHGAG